MIRSFGDIATADLFHGIESNRVRRYPGEIIDSCLKKLDIINGAVSHLYLRSPPGNRLELLKGDRKDFTASVSISSGV